MGWRLLGPYGGLALSLDSAQAASAASAALNGHTMLMQPLSASLLSYFPDNEHLSGLAQGIAMRASASNASYLEVMSSLWQKLQELPPVEHFLAAQALASGPKVVPQAGFEWSGAKLGL